MAMPFQQALRHTVRFVFWLELVASFCRSQYKIGIHAAADDDSSGIQECLDRSMTWAVAVSGEACAC
jgi:hypothetical protein